MRGTTLNVPSFWMLACTRSLMKRASRSSSYSLPQRVLRSEARPILLGASSRPLASAANTAETLRRPRSLISRISSGFGSGTPGTYQCTDGSSTGASPTQLSKSALTSFLHEPQPVPARVALCDATRAGTGCGSCKKDVKALFESCVGDAPVEDPSVHWYVPGVPLPKPELIREIKLRGLCSVSAVFAALANGREDAPSKIGLASLLKTLWGKEYDDERDARFINDRVHANIQKDGTFSV